jgi:hypothetical protein
MTPSLVARQPAGWSRAVSWLAALAPLWLLLVIAIASSGFGAVLSPLPDLAGLPLGVVLEVVALVWMLGGVAVVWRAPSALAESIALMVFTIPATVVVVLTPAVIELLRTLD